MARKPRVHYEGAFYHVTARGNNKSEVFRDEEDKQKYMDLVKKYGRKYAVTLHAYVLMDNHLHLLAQVAETPLSRYMQLVQQCYTQYFNRRHRRVGHLFQGRYNAELITNDVYLLEVVKYIHLNPVKAGLVERPDEYPWSSYRHYAFGQGMGPVKTGFITSVLKEYGLADTLSYDPAANLTGKEISILKQPGENKVQKLPKWQRDHLKLEKIL